MFCTIRALGGIPLLVSLLSHEQQEVQKAACGALRNLSCGRVNDTNKVSSSYCVMFVYIKLPTR